MTLVAVADARTILGTVVAYRADLSQPHAAIWEGRRGHLRVVVTRVPQIASRPGSWSVAVYPTAGTLSGRRVLLERATSWGGLCRRADVAWRALYADHRARLAARVQAEAMHAEVWRGVGAPESIEAAVLACVGGAS